MRTRDPKPEKPSRLVFGLLVLASCVEDVPTSFAPKPDPAAHRVEIAPRTPVLSMLPCQDGRCHSEGQIGTEIKPLQDFHRGKQLDHGSTVVWCVWCHAMQDLEKLRLLDGTLVGFDEGYKLCGQCHGDRFRDWKLGIHGRQTGQWTGLKTRLSCPACHNPHRPKFQPLEAKPPPLPLREDLSHASTSKGAHHEP
ncbi:MAG: hypothetical protein HYV07_13860 [Deltaproteobacteria bacterium]|nr:hypothetical protein [Deltaproteobacteria bacterium]